MITIEENERAKKTLEVIEGKELLRLASESIVNTILDTVLDKNVPDCIAFNILWTYADRLDKALANYELG